MDVTAKLSKYVPFRVRDRGSDIFRGGSVKLRKATHDYVEATVRGTRDYAVFVTRESEDLLVSCDCPYFASDGPCKHVWATLLAAGSGGHLGGDSNLPPTDLIDVPDADEMSDEVDEYFDSLQYTPASPSLAPFRTPWQPPKPTWRDAVRTIGFAPQRSVETWPEDRELYYLIDVANTHYSGSLSVCIVYRDRKKDGAYGKVKYQRIPRDLVAMIPSKEDRDLLAMLAGVPNPASYNDQQSIPIDYRLNNGAVDMLLQRLCATGRLRLRKNNSVDFEEQTALNWDPAPPWDFRVKVDRDKDQWVFTGVLVRAEERLRLDTVDLLMDNGVVIGGNLVSRFNHKGAYPWVAHLRRTGALKVPVKDSDELVRTMLEHPAPPPVDWPDELRCEIVEIEPRPQILIDSPGEFARKTATHSAYLSFDYDGVVFGFSDQAKFRFAEGVRKAVRRNPEAEKAAVELLTGCGCTPRRYMDDCFSISPSRVPKVLSAAVRSGWHVRFRGKVFRTLRDSALSSRLRSIGSNCTVRWISVITR